MVCSETSILIVVEPHISLSPITMRLFSRIAGYYAALWPYFPFQYETSVDANTLYY